MASRYSGDLGNSNGSIHSFARPPGPNVESEPVPQSVYDRALFEASQLIHLNAMSRPVTSATFMPLRCVCHVTCHMTTCHMT